VLSQTYSDFELIVVDGASTDGTLDVLKGVQKHLSFFISEPDSGIYDALNKGIIQATGDFVGILHSDDLLADEMVLEKIANCFSQNKADAIYGDLVYVAKDNVEDTFRYWESGDFNRNSMIRVLKNKAVNVYIRDVLVKMRVGGASNRSLENIVKKSREDYRILKSHGYSGWSALFLKNISKFPQFFNRTK
jgi:glycosyltransferase